MIRMRKSIVVGLRRLESENVFIPLPYPYASEKL